MIFTPPLVEAHLLKRYKRFLADVEHPKLGHFTVHCPNTGSMKNCWNQGDMVWLHDSQNPKRKYPFTWVLRQSVEGHMLCVNTHLANQLVAEAIENHTIGELQGYHTLRQEVKYGDENSRIDLLLTDTNRRDCYIEIKTVTLLEPECGHGRGYFPDAVSSRGQKHLRELISMVEAGHRAVLLFLVQHTGIKTVSPAQHIDEKYSQLLALAAQKGVEIIAYNTHISPIEIKVKQLLPVIF